MVNFEGQENSPHTRAIAAAEKLNESQNPTELRQAIMDPDTDLEAFLDKLDFDWVNTYFNSGESDKTDTNLTDTEIKMAIKVTNKDPQERKVILNSMLEQVRNEEAEKEDFLRFLKALNQVGDRFEIDANIIALTNEFKQKLNSESSPNSKYKKIWNNPESITDYDLNDEELVELLSFYEDDSNSRNVSTFTISGDLSQKIRDYAKENSINIDGELEKKLNILSDFENMRSSQDT